MEADLPDMSCTAFLSKLNKHAKAPRIIMTDNLNKDSDPFLNGADVFLVKPVEPPTLVALLSERLGGKWQSSV